MLMKLRGVFAFTILDTELDVIIMARDPLGVRSMYYSMDSAGLGVCSELKGLYPLADAASINQFPGGCWGTLDYGNTAKDGKLIIQRYYDVLAPVDFTDESESQVTQHLTTLLTGSIQRRIMCDRKTSDGQPAVGAFLSGGLDSSTIACLLTDIYPGKLHTFSIGFKDAPDLLAARTVAAHIESEHHEVVVTEDEMLELLERVPKIIESYDVTTNRASAFMLRLSEYIRDNTDIIVVYSGEGADELFGSYLYFHKAPSSDAFHSETDRLLFDLQYFDLLRGDKSSAAAGLEIRVPCLDIDFVNYIRTIPSSMKLQYGVEKYIFRKAISNTGLVPSEICWRTKEAMSDGVSLDDRSWNTIIQDHVVGDSQRHCSYVVGMSGSRVRSTVDDPIDLEKQWLKRAFNRAYPGCEGTIPYEWLPKWCDDVKDASARVLDVYKH
jgi:asparagine synthase (glutamine-hydrolysing)